MDISKYCKGLPGILGLKERGRGLPVLGDALAATLESRDLYLLDTRELVSFTGVAAAVGQNLFANPVPNGELWYCWSYQLIALPGVGTSLDAAPAAQLDGLLVTLTGDYMVAPASSQILIRSAQPFWAGPGTTFAAFVRAVTGAVTVGANAVVTKIRV